MKQFNKYDILIILTIAVLAWGNYEALRFLYPIRIIGLYGLFVLASNWNLIKFNYKKWCSLFVIWALYIVFSLLWTPNIGEGFTQAIHIITVFGAMGLMMVSALKAQKPLNSIVLGWAAMVLITLPIAIWEIVTGKHLISAFNVDIVSNGVQRVSAAVTFGNINSYAVVLTSALPFIITGWVGNKKDTQFRIALMVLTAIIGVILLLNASRGCLICFIISLLLITLYQMKGRFSLFRLILVIGVLGGVYYYATEKLNLDLLVQISSRLENEGYDMGRDEVYLAGLDVAKHSIYMGGGVASTVPYLTAYSSCPVKVTHNAFLEIFIEYGIIIFVLFWWRFYMGALRMWKSDNIKVVLIGAYYLIAAVVLFSVDDYYTGESVFWIFTASMIILSTLYKPKRKVRVFEPKHIQET